MLLVHAEDDGLGEAIRFLQEVRKVAGDGFGTGFKRDQPVEIRRAVKAVRDLPAVAIHLAGRRPPACSIDGGDDAVHAVGRKEAVIDALPEAVGVERIVEIAVCVAVVLPQRRCRHAELICRLEILQNLPPVAFVAGAAAVALVHDDEIEEIPGIVAV